MSNLEKKNSRQRVIKKNEADMDNNRTVTFLNEFIQAPFSIKDGKSYVQYKDGVRKEVSCAALPNVVEFKIFLKLVGNINPISDVEAKTFTFDRLGFINAFGLHNKTSYPKIKEIVESLFGMHLKYKDGSKWCNISILDIAGGDDDSKTITLKLGEGLLRFVLIGDVNFVEKKQENFSLTLDESSDDSGSVVKRAKGFTSIPERYLMILKTVYSIRLYMYLYSLKNLATGAVIKDIDNLKKMFGLDMDYKNKDFIRNILKPAVEEIATNTDLKVEFELKTGSDKKSYKNVVFRISVKESKMVVDKDFILKQIEEKTGNSVAKDDLDNVIKVFSATSLERYNKKIKEQEILTLIAIAGGDPNKAFNLYKEAVTSNATNIIAKTRAIANKQNIVPLKLYI